MLCLYTIGFCDQVTSWSEELCNQKSSLVGDWSHVLGAVHWKGEIVTTEQVQLGVGVRVQL